MARIFKRSGSQLTVEVTMNISGCLLEAEEAIQAVCNEVGQLATQEAIVGLDTDGSAIQTGSVKWTSTGKPGQTYQTPYGKVNLAPMDRQVAKSFRIV